MIVDNALMQDFLLPFLFSFSLMFGLLEIAGILKNRWAQIFIALSIAGFAVSNPQTIAFIKAVMPMGVIGSVAVFSLYAVYVIVYEKMVKGKQNENTAGIVGVALLSLIVALQTPYVWKLMPNTQIMSRSDALFIAGLAVVVVMFLWAYREGFTK